VGPVLFERSKRSRHINISVIPFKGVRVAVPRGVSFRQAQDEAISHKGWLRRRLAAMEKTERDYVAASSGLNVLDREKAKKTLAGRVNELARGYGLVYEKLVIRDKRSQWGSCSPGNRISLNIKLARLPDELIDYVILHELAHTRIKNHGRRFWSFLDGVFGDARALDAQLRKYHLELL